MMNRGGFLFIFVQRFWVNPLSVLIKVESPIVGGQTLHSRLHSGHLADAFIQSDLQQVY